MSTSSAAPTRVRSSSTKFDTQDQSYMMAAQLDAGKWMQLETVGWRIGLYGGWGETAVNFKAQGDLAAQGLKSTGAGTNETGFAGIYSLTTVGNVYSLVTATGAMGKSTLANPILHATGKYDTVGLVGAAVAGVVIPLSVKTEAGSGYGLDLRAGGSYSQNLGGSFTDTAGNKVGETVLQAVVGTTAARIFYGYNENGMRFSPFVQVGYNYRFRYDNTVTVADTAFRFDDAKDSYYAASGIDFSVTDSIQMNLTTRGERSAEQTIFSGALGVKILLN